MMLHIGFWSGLLLCLLAACGCIYQLIALFLVRRHFSQPLEMVEAGGGVTVLKPLHGTEPLLEANLESFFEQDISGGVQLVFGVEDPGDPATRAVASLHRKHPDADIAVTTGPPMHASNRKIANLANMMSVAKHDLLVMSDSDMAVPRDYLAAILGTLRQSGVGAVSCLYRGRGDAGFWSRLSAGAISYIQMPAMVVGYATNMAQPCMGSTIALRRETLQAIGGFSRFADVLADDYAIGEAVLATGQNIRIPPMLLTHGCSEASFAALWRQKLRWAATIRGIAPMRHTGSAITYPLPFAISAAFFLPVAGLALATASLAIRAVTAAVVDRKAGAQSAAFWLLPAIELVEFAAFIASFVIRDIDWRGSRLTIRSDGRTAHKRTS